MRVFVGWMIFGVFWGFFCGGKGEDGFGFEKGVGR